MNNICLTDIKTKIKGKAMLLAYLVECEEIPVQAGICLICEK
jgi:hypothetical protein